MVFAPQHFNFLGLHVNFFLVLGNFLQVTTNTNVTCYLFSACNKITVRASQLNIITFIFPVILKILKKHSRFTAKFKRTGKGLTNAVPLMVFELLVLEFLRTLLALKFELLKKFHHYSVRLCRIVW